MSQHAHSPAIPIQLREVFLWRLLINWCNYRQRVARFHVVVVWAEGTPHQKIGTGGVRFYTVRNSFEPMHPITPFFRYFPQHHVVVIWFTTKFQAPIVELVFWGEPGYDGILSTDWAWLARKMVQLGMINSGYTNSCARGWIYIRGNCLKQMWVKFTSHLAKNGFF
jgi:hypothetical protein